MDRVDRAEMAAHGSAERRLSALASHTKAAAGRAAAAESGDLAEAQLPFSREPLLREDVLTAFDAGAWERDGYVVLPGALTEAATGRFTTSLTRLQGVDDHIIQETDWAGTDWEAYGLPTPPGPITPERLAQMSGGQERGFNLLPGHKVAHSWNPGKQNGSLWDEAPVAFPPGVSNQGILPSRFPLAYDRFLWDVTTLGHPQFRKLQQLLLQGCAATDIRMDHVHMLNRRGPDGGRTWHAHPYDQDGYGTTERYIGLGLVRTICYPQGCGNAEGDGGLSLIKGAHLFRDPYCWNTSRPTGTEEAMQRAWLSGRTHPLTGEPLAVTKIALPPGSLVCFGHHMPHYVGSINESHGTRLGLLMVFRRPDPKGRLRSCDRNIPDEWVQREWEEGGLTEAEHRLLREF